MSVSVRILTMTQLRRPAQEMVVRISVIFIVLNFLAQREKRAEKSRAETLRPSPGQAQRSRGGGNHCVVDWLTCNPYRWHVTLKGSLWIRLTGRDPCGVTCSLAP